MTDISDGRTEINGKPYLVNPKGGFVPLPAVKPVDLLQDELVRKIVRYAMPLSDQVARFREHCFDDVDGFVALLEQEYGAKRGGSKGNLTFITFDGLLKVTVQVADQISFGPELQIAKSLVDECVREWSADSGPELQAIVNRAFDVDKQGGINRNDLFALLRLEIADERWKRAMTAIRDSIRPIGSKRYVRIHRRADPEAAWQPISIDMATA